MQFTGSVPSYYDRCLGPHLFVDYGADLANRVARTQPGSVLELAAGSGIVTRILRDQLPADTTITATDLNEAMLEVAAPKFGPDERVELRSADACALPFDDDSFDTVACQFGVMFFPDKDLSYREVWRTLVPGGHYVFSTWDSFEHNPFAVLAQETATRFFADAPPTFYEIPFGYHEIESIEASLGAAGFEDVDVDVVALEKEIPDVELFAEGLVFGNPLIEEIRSRASAEPEEIMAAIAQALRDSFGDKPGRMPLRAIVVSARKP